MPAKAIAYLNSYTASNSMDGDPWTNYRIGKEHGLVGCSKDLRRMSVPWLTKVEDHLIYHGKLICPSEKSLWSEAGCHFFKVECHYDLGLMDTVLVNAGVSESILPKGKSISLTDASAERLIEYAHAKYLDSLSTASLNSSSSATVESPVESKTEASTTLTGLEEEDPSSSPTSCSLCHEYNLKLLELQEEMAQLLDKNSRLIAALHLMID
jgi:hypothetical protein